MEQPPPVVVGDSVGGRMSKQLFRRINPNELFDGQAPSDDEYMRTEKGLVGHPPPVGISVG